MSERPQSFEVGHATHVGLRREMNEDRVYAPPTSGVALDARGHLFVVADGMGGYEAGEEAAEICVSALSEVFYAADSAGASAEERIRRGLELAHERITVEQKRDPAKGQMGSVVAGFALDGSRAVVFNIGDSRCYLLRDGALANKGIDHSWVAEQARNGILTQAETRHHPYRSVITRALGQANHEPEISVSETNPGDTFLACSDGVWDMVSDDDIARILSKLPPQLAADELVKQANIAGGPDNISVVVARIPGAEAAPAGAKYGSALNILAGMVAVLACVAVLAGGVLAKKFIFDSVSAPAATATPGVVVLAVASPVPAPTATAGKSSQLAPTPASTSKPAAGPSTLPTAATTPASTPSAPPPAKPAQIFVCGAAQFDLTSRKCTQDQPILDVAAGAGIYATWPQEWVNGRAFTITWRRVGEARVANYQCDFDANGQVNCKPLGRSSFAARQTASSAYIEQGDSLLENANYQLTLSTASGVKEKVFNIKTAR